MPRTNRILAQGALLILLFVCANLLAAESEEQAAINNAELKMLRNTVARQTKELDQLKADNAALRKELETLRGSSAPAAPVEPAKPTESNPAPASVNTGERKPRNVLFVISTNENYILGYHNAMADVLRAIEQLRADQSFNVLVHGSKGVTSMQKSNFVAAGPENHRRASEFLRMNHGNSGRLEDVIRVAIKWKPDAICLLFAGNLKDRDATLQTVREHNTGSKIPIHTSIKYVRQDPASAHALWQLAKDSGGICTSSEGKAADEPVVPAVVAPAPKPVTPPPPTVFQIK